MSLPTHLFVGSSNPVKVGAVQQAVAAAWPGAVVVGFSVPSGVAAQPFSDQETLTGAQNRARAVLAAGLAAHPEAKEALGVGLEGGVFEAEDGHLWSTVWVAVVDRDQHVFTANGMRMKLPTSIAEPMRAGTEMAYVMERLTGISDLRSQEGMIGAVTQNFVSRTEEYAAIAKLAIGLWYGRKWEKSAAVDGK